MLGNPVSIQHQRNARLLSKSTLQGAGTHRTSGRQAQALQAYRVSMREDGAELRLVRRACSRLYLDQIRPHGLVSIVACTPYVEVLDLEMDSQVFVIVRYSPWVCANLFRACAPEVREWPVHGS